MVENDIITPSIITDPTIYSLIFQSISKYAVRSSITLPSTFKEIKIDLHSDRHGYISSQGEQIPKALMGTAFDYATRLVVCHDLNAFDFLMEQFPQVNPQFFERIKYQLANLINNCKEVFKNIAIEDLDESGILLLLYLSQFEQCFRSGYFKADEKFQVTDTTISHFKIMLHRSKNFFEKFGYPKIIDYHSAISSDGTPNIEAPLPKDYIGKNISDLKTWLIGDGDYLLSDSLVDFKVSVHNKEKTAWKKQLIIYYLGLYQEELTEHNVKQTDLHYLLNFNPRYDTVYKIEIDPLDYKPWTNFAIKVNQDISSDSQKAQRFAKKMIMDSKVRELTTAEQAEFIRNPFNKYEDGIHRISRLEYYYFYRNVINRPNGVTCGYPGQLWMVKRDGFYAFFLENANKHTFKILNGGSPRLTDHNLHYFYDNLPKYGNILTKAFTPYQSYLDELAREIRAIGGDGKNHGSIVDVDFYNHVYLDPMTGEIKYYSAPSISERKIYSSIVSLLKSNKRLFLLGDNAQPTKLIENYKNNLPKMKLLELEPKNNKQLMLPSNSNELLRVNNLGDEGKEEDYYDHDMYGKSKAMNAIQKMLRYHVAVFWNEKILLHTYDNVTAQEKYLNNQTKIEAEVKKNKMAEIEESRKRLSNTIQEFDNSIYSSKKMKQFKAKKITKPKKHVSFKGMDISLVRKLIDISFKIDSEVIDWNQIANENKIELQIDDKNSELLDELRKRIILLFEKIGHPDKVNVFIKNSDEKYVGFADFQVKNKLVVLDLMDDSKLNKRMLQNIKVSAEKINLRPTIYKVWQGQLMMI